MSTPLSVALATGAVALVVVALRVLVAGHGHVGRLVLVGSNFVVPGGRPGVPVTPGNGYDGQFYYRLALDPLNFSAFVHGMHMDSAARFERIAYPALAWAGSGGHEGLVPWSLIAVNVLALGVVGWLGALLARDGGKAPVWGLLLPAYFGFVWSLSRDLTEIVEITFLVAGLVAIRRRRPVLAGVVLAGAVLSRETSLVTVGAVALVQVIGWWRHRRYRAERPSLHPVTWILPVLAFAGWQAFAGVELGHLPLLASGQHNLGIPFAGLARGFEHYATRLPSKDSVLWFGELAVLCLVVVSTGRSVLSASVRIHERLAWAGYGVLSVCLSSGIWLGDVGFRSLDDLYA
ncbi:MAG TPA: hypothetical protein VMB72_11570, partial [Acidimicrobiales bacterium]|nr:hypothetical protein [Acidimicrobiales bacterium]